MRRKDTAKYDLINDAIKSFLLEKSYIPSGREIAERLDLPVTTISRYLNDMEKLGLIERNGTSIVTNETRVKAIPILNSLSDPEHIFDNASSKDHIFISRSFVDTDDELAALRIPDNSMEYGNIRKGNLVLVKRQNYAEDGQIVLVLCPDNTFYLRRYKYCKDTKKATLIAESAGVYPEINNYEIRAVADRVLAKL